MTTTHAPELLRVASAEIPASIAAAKRQLKAAGLRQSRADDLMAAANAVVAGRLARNQRRYTSRGERWIGRPAVRLPKNTLAERLAALRKTSVRAAYVAAHKTAAHGSVSVVLTDDPAAVGVAQVESVDWKLYRGKFKGRPARVQDTTITAPSTWRVRVEGRGLAVCDGMMTLDAAPIDAQGCEIFAATWIEQGRGTSVRVVRGYIARGGRSGRSTYHGETAEKAAAGLRRKIAPSAPSALAVSHETLITLASRRPTATVRLSDAKAVGACEYGVRSWCSSVGIDYAAGATTLDRVVSGYKREPRPEARAVIVRVLRRHRAISAE